MGEVLKYATRLSQSKEQNDASLAPARAVETEQKVRHRISEVNIQIAEANNTLQVAYSSYPLDTDKVVTVKNQIAIAERTKKLLEETLAELF